MTEKLVVSYFPYETKGVPNVVRDIRKILRERILDNSWKLDIQEIFLTVSDLDEFDYAIILHCFENMVNSEDNYFRKTNLMWDLNLTPNFYRELADSVDKLVEKGFLEEKQISSESCDNPRFVYWLSSSGRCFCEGLIQTKTL